MTNEDLKKAENPCLKCSKLHRRAQAAESEVAKLKARVRFLEGKLSFQVAQKRDHMAEVIETYR